MNQGFALRLNAELPADALVIDVGGGGQPYFRADYVLDATPFSAAAPPVEGGVPRYTEKTWILFDMCSRDRWPIADKFFDYAVCSQTLEDIRDPVWVCSELSRIAKAGYIETPSRIVEQTIGVENPNYAGYYHHRWLLSERDGGVEFRHKPHLLHSLPQAIVTRVNARQKINPEYENFHLEWTGQLTAREVLEFDEDLVIQELAEYAQSVRTLPKLTVPNAKPFWKNVKRSIFFQRLRWART